MKGVVSKIATKTGTNRRGQWTLYSFITKDDSGNERGWVTYGFEFPPFKEGDLIEYETEQDGEYTKYKQGTGKILRRPKDQPATTPAASASTTTASSSTASTGYDARQQQIVLQHSQEMAIQATALLLEHDALPITKASTKAGEAKRFEEIVASVDKLTVKYFNDVVSGRLLVTVPDMGVVSTAPDGPIPTASAEQPNVSKSEY